ncbi:TPA: thioredoxin family protein [Enterobacter ludwigii]|uniref:thioredoxin family protein n=1 Tax=Enterobacter hormaechei TaxID=158836 RepID=UPI001C6A3CB4|nr:MULTISPECIES: thioredoxin family protein [Enterobacter cloacae complex]EMD2746890.1 thioredoxin family protein [Enterobacter ludwigii]MCO6029631.1 thioredoxin family protein [Enterobacter hormaechei]QYR12345.1 thioredoxin family protein [Enterobacter ludwigii]HDS4679267.1 thioredoxin family protein [Enterobacter ludwigii]
MQDFNVLLEAASDYNEFVGSGAEEDRNALRHFEGLANEALPDDVISKLSQLPGSYSILVAAEMWCPDCHKNLPVIHAIAASTPAIRLGIITRDKAEAVFKAHFGVDKVKIPFAVVLDENVTPLGQFIERPKTAIGKNGEVSESYKNGELLVDTAREVASIFPGK